jgi:hypothetical protein
MQKLASPGHPSAAPTNLALNTLLASLNPRNTLVATAFTPQHNAHKPLPALSPRMNCLLSTLATCAHNNVHVECTSSPLACLPQRDDDLLLGCLGGIGEGKSHAMAPFLAERQRTSLIPCKAPSIPQAHQAPKIWEYPFWCQSPPNVDEDVS